MAWSAATCPPPVIGLRRLPCRDSFARARRFGLNGLLATCAAGLALPLVAPAQAATEQGPQAVEAPPAGGQPQARTSFQLPVASPRVALLESGPDPQAAPQAQPGGGRFGGPFPISPERRALLNTIRYAEGTWANGQDLGYWIMFGGGLAPSLDRHPDRVIRTSRYASAAAGAYQFMPFTWALASRLLGLRGFGPEVQDQAALLLVQRRGALPLADQGSFTPELAAKLAPEWASFPTLAGRSYYGQPVKRYDALRRFYQENLAKLRASQDYGNPSLAAVPAPPAPPACTDGSLECALQQVGN